MLTRITLNMLFVLYVGPEDPLFNRIHVGSASEREHKSFSVDKKNQLDVTFCILTYQPDLTTFLQPRHIPTQGYNIRQSSAPDDGHMVARNMLSSYWKRNKEYKK